VYDPYNMQNMHNTYYRILPRLNKGYASGQHPISETRGN
jgi:hypothetical protein